jgi:hypothetical protein
MKPGHINYHHLARSERHVTLLVLLAAVLHQHDHCASASSLSGGPLVPVEHIRQMEKRPAKVSGRATEFHADGDLVSVVAFARMRLCQ